MGLFNSKKGKVGVVKSTRMIMDEYISIYEFNNYDVEKYLEKKWVCVDDLLKLELLSKEQHDILVTEVGFKKVKSRCPVCYTEDLIRKNLKKRLEGL